MTTIAARSRTAGGIALLALGALAMHELRYRLAHGAEAGAELARTGHGYLDVAVPLVAVLAIATLLISVLAPAILRAAPSLRTAGSSERAAGYAAALLAVHLGQELVEGLISPGYGGLVEVIGSGGVLVWPLAIVLGALAALGRGWLERAEDRLRAVLWRRPAPRAPRRIARPPSPVTRALASRGLAFGLARRPPPLATRP